MKNPSLIPLAVVVVLLLAVSSLPPIAGVAVRIYEAGTSHIECVSGGVYAANSTFEANRRRLAGLLLAEAAAGGPYFAKRAAVGYWPNRPQASFFCGRLVGRRDVNGTGSGDSPCAACIAGAFLELERACPYQREVSFYGRNCTLQLGEYRIFGPASMHGGNKLTQAMAPVLLFQAIGFAWLFFLLLQEWRSRRK